MRFSRPVLYGLSLVAGLVGYLVAVWVIGALPVPGLSDSLVGMFLPLLVSGLFMLPFVIPFLDQKAKGDLAAHRAAVTAAGEARGEAVPKSTRGPQQARARGGRGRQRRGGGRGTKRQGMPRK
jgi:hypothetical protein